MTRIELEKAYFDLAKILEERYPKKSYRNHCYWRIALDHELGKKWDKILSRPAYKNLTDDQLKKVIDLLRQYLEDEALLEDHNLQSLSYRRS